MAASQTNLLAIAIFDSPFLGPGLLLAGALLAGALVIAWVRRWQRDTRTPATEASDQLSRYRALYERGAISEEEYQRLRRSLHEDLTGLPPPPAPPSPPNPEPPAQTDIKPP